MGICAECGKDHAGCGGPAKVDGTATGCKKKGGIVAYVADDAGNNIAGVPVKKDGGGDTDTNGSGTSTFASLDPGSYTVDLGTLSKQLQDDYDLPKKTSQKVKVKDGANTVVNYELVRKVPLKVKVVSKDGSKLFQDAAVEVTGPTSANKKTGANGVADCNKVSAGKYSIKVTLKKADEDDWATTTDFSKKTEQITLSPGDNKGDGNEVVIEVEEKNVVTPKLEVEYHVVLWDNKLHAKQNKGTKIMASPTYVEVSIEQTNDDHKFAKGAKIECTPANAEIYLDEEMTKKVSGGKLKNDQISDDDPLKLYLKGVTAGKFTAKVTLDDPDDRFVKLKDNPTPDVKMGVVKIEMKVHKQDVDKLKAAAMQVDPDTDPEDTYYTNLDSKAIPAQKLMTDEEKIGYPSSDDGSKPGRLLHLQSGGNFGRAQIILSKIDPAHVPDEADAYEIVLNTGRGYALPGELKTKDLMGGASDTPASGNVAFWDLEFQGAQQNPAKITIAALKAAEKTFYVEGTAETDRTCDVRVDAGLDRAPAGLTHTVKRNGDWARFSVVKIKEVKVVYKPKSGKANAWDAGTNRFYVNFREGVAGRNLDIEMELNKPFKGIPVYFMMAPDQSNKKTANWGKDMPAAWKWKDIKPDLKHKDKEDRKDFLHFSAKTDAEGKAKKTLRVSRFGGDKFWPACYVEEDAHLAKYVDGHAQLGTKVPVRSNNAVEVWRKFWIQQVTVPCAPTPGFAGATTEYQDVKAELAEANPKAVSLADAKKLKGVYPRYMIEVNGGAADALVATALNKHQFVKGIKSEADKPVKVPILVCDAQYDPDGNTTANTTPWTRTNAPISIRTDKKIVKPPLQSGALVVSGRLEYKYRDGTGTWVTDAVDLTDALVDVDPARGNRNDARVNLPAEVTNCFAAHGSTRIRVNGLVLQGAASFAGESFGGNVLAKFVPTNPADFQDTITHELGHFFGQTPKPGSPGEGIPNHPNQETLRTGSHCKLDQCVMYFKSDAACFHRYCDDCHPYLLAQDFQLKKG